MKEIMDSGRIEAYLREYQLAETFPKPLLTHLRLYHFEQGELICSKGDPAAVLYVLVKGKVKVFTTSAEGKTIILCFRTPLDLIGDVEYVQDAEYLNTVEAVSPVLMIGISYRLLRKHASIHPPLLQFLLKMITHKFYTKSISMSFSLLYPVEVRLASYLLSVSYDKSDEEFRGELSTYKLTDVANLIGTSYRHLNRIIRKLSSEQLIERRRGSIVVIDREKLSELAGSNIYEK
ncbi:Crp/Fnr family transcriptional regulator [Gorillibacterium massiliense]|uniref:Crp/Fnr family transcriptional regulator n=1 Tax=Gorillibacterium massiliense TaxID=1280390 RepID=UPI0004B73C7C|nr:cyclic nucleotide-binding domain-containing protein [Gorillibacterium massiliense]